WGISKRSYPALDIKRLTRAQAVEIYRRDFWLAQQCDKLPPAIAFQLLDAGVNHGRGNAIRWLQAAVGVTQDGAIGPVTLAAVRRAPCGHQRRAAAVQRLAPRVLRLA